MPTTTISQDDINKALWGSCDAFRAAVPPSIYKDFILAMLFLKYISDVHQEHDEKLVAEHVDTPALIDNQMTNECFVLPTDASFWNLYAHRHAAGNGARIDKALHALEEVNATKLKNVFQNISFNSDKLGEESQNDEILRHLLEYFAQDKLSLRPSRVGSLDVMGHAYEYLLKHFAVGSAKSAGDFYTPPEVSDLLSLLLEPVEGDQICDPVCGSGSLLIKCGRQIRSRFAGSSKYALFGQEAIKSTWSLAKMNLFLHGEDNHRIEWGDTIRHPKLLEQNGTLMQFDVVAANPPFSLDRWDHESAADDKFARFHRGVPPKTKGDYAFISHMIETLRPASEGKKGGRMGVIVPHGVLFRSSSEAKIRQQLIDENLLEAVIGLPGKLFFGTGIPAAILIFKKQKNDPKVLFIDASREFASSKNKNVLTPENIKKIISTYKARKTTNKYSYLATLSEIAENDYNLNIPRYVDTVEEEAEIDLMAVREDRLALQSELQALETEMAGYLKELGYGA